MFITPRGSSGSSGGTTPTGGDMYKATYDINNDGVVDFAQGVDWTNITNIPALFPPSLHSHGLVSIGASGFMPSLPGDPDVMLNGMGNWVAIPNSSPGLTEVRWGDIIGSITNQVDLAAALDSKVPVTRTINGQALTANVVLPIPTTLSALTDDATHRLVTDAEKASWNSKQNALGFTPENAANKNTAGGYVGLGSNGKIDSTYLPSLSLINSITSGTAYPASPTKGDVCIRTDLTKTYIYSGTEWLEMTATAGIMSVNGKSGSAITITKADIGLSEVENVKAIPAITGATIGNIPVWADTGSFLGVGFGVTTVISGNGSDTVIPTEKAVKDIIIAHQHVLANIGINGLIPAIPDDDTYFLNGKNQWSKVISVTGQNMGTGAGVFVQKSGGNLQFKSIRAGTNISITENSNEIIISGTGATGGTSAWGGITGTLSDQLDLITALNALVPKTRTINGLALVGDILIPVPTKLSDLSADSTHRTVTDTQISDWSNKQNVLGFTPENSANKGIANGYAPLGSDGKVPAAFLNAVASINGKTGVVVLTPEDLGLAFGTTSNTIARGDHNHDTRYLGIISKAVDSDKLNGLSASSYALATHNHDTAYLGLHGKADSAINADNLGGQGPEHYAIVDHDHAGIYLTVTGKAADSDKLDGYEASDFALSTHNHTGTYEPALGFTPENTANKGAANGYVPLNELGKIPAGFIGAMELTNVTVGTAYPTIKNEGDVCIRTDSGKTYIYDGTDWIELLVPNGYVQSVNGKTGSALTLVAADIGITLGNTAGTFAEGNHTHAGVYLPVSGKAADSELLDGHESNYFAEANHEHLGVYLSVNGTASNSKLFDGHAVSEFSQVGHTHSGYQSALGFTPENVSNKGIANGYVPLNASSLIDSEYLPEIPTGTTVSSGTAFPSSPVEGDICIRTDESKTYAFDGTDWVSFVTTISGKTYVESVNGKTGSAISITKSDLSLGNVTNDKQMKATTGAVSGQIPVWANSGDTLSSVGYSVVTSINASPTDSNIPTEKAVKALFDSIPTTAIDSTPVSAGAHAISSGWAYTHANNGTSNVKHLTNAQLANLHSPITVSGIGLVLSGQQLGLSIGTGSTQVARGDHGHGEYLLKTGKATDSSLLNGKNDTMFAPSVHIHAHADLDGAGTNTHAQIDAFIASKAQTNGLASLGNDGKIPTAQLPSSIGGGLEYKGTYTGTSYPASPASGDFYIISAECTISGHTYKAGDWIIYDGTAWESIEVASVTSVDGMTGAVELYDVYAEIDHNHVLTELTDSDLVNPIHAQYVGWDATTQKHKYFSVPQAPNALTPLRNETAALNTLVAFADNAGASVKKTDIQVIENRMFNVIIDGGNLDLL